MICDGLGTPLKFITTAANVNDVNQTLALVDGMPPVAGHADAPMPCSATRATTPTPTATSFANAGSCRSSPARAPRTSRVWASSATSWSRPSPCSTTSKGSPSDGNAAPNSTTHSYPWPAASSAGDVSTGPNHEGSEGERFRVQ
ncbi:hypothetical protein [Streptomyces canus]|uniref:hypothetical protein n=1 Tax=Streptomyces canus TaxID=58343 RepID=UPI00385103EA